jgi:hypothetical protein
MKTNDNLSDIVSMIDWQLSSIIIDMNDIIKEIQDLKNELEALDDIG